MSGYCPGCTNTCPTAALCRDEAVDVIEGEIVEDAESLDSGETVESTAADSLESVDSTAADSLENTTDVAAVAPASPKGTVTDFAREPHGDSGESSQGVRTPSDGAVAPTTDSDALQEDPADDEEDQPTGGFRKYNPPTEKRRCRAKAKSTGQQCKQWALPGLGVCEYHGAGGTHPSKQEGKVRVQKEKRTKQLKAKAAAVLAHEGLQPVEDPILELGKLAAASQKMMESMGKRVNALNSVEHYDSKNSINIRAEVELYERAMDRTTNLLDKLVKHGYTERLVQIQEAEVMIILGVLNRALSRLQLAPEQLKQAKAYLAEEFRALEPRKLDGGR